MWIDRIRRWIGASRRLAQENANLRREIDALREELSRREEEVHGIGALMTLENEVLKKGMADIQGNMARSVEEAKRSLADIEKIVESFGMLIGDMTTVVDETGDMSAGTGRSKNAVAKLGENANQISEVVELIKAIASQINLIALNAAVEAARAGEAGKGFAVVANEVKALSDKTRAALETIDKMIGDMRSSVEEVAQMSSSLAQGCNSVAGCVTRFQGSLDHVSNDLAGKLDRIVASADDTFLSLAKLDHLIWNVNTYLSVNRGEPAFEFVDHHSCRLGKWYEQGDGKRFFSGSKVYQGLEAPHATVHEQTREVFRLLSDNGERPDYGALLGCFRIMAEATDGVLDSLSRMSRST